MCDPITLGVTAAITTAVGVASEVKAAQNQKKAIGEALQISYGQNEVARVAAVNDRVRAARKEQSRIKVAAGEAGLSLGSGSIEQLLLDSQMQTALANERTNLNADYANDSARRQADSAYSHINEPSLLGAGLQIGLAGYNAFKQADSLKITRKKSSAAAGQAVVY